MRATTFVLCVLATLCIASISVSAIAHDRAHPRQSSRPSQSSSLVEESADANVDESDSIMSSLRALLASKKASGEAARTRLESAAQHTLAVEASLAAKSTQLKSHTALLGRLEQCLSQGPSSQRYAALEASTRARETILLESQSTLAQKDQLVAEAQEEVAAQRSSLESQQSELNEKLRSLRSSTAHLATQRAELESQARSVAERETRMESLIETKITDGVANKLDALRASLTARADEKLHAVQAAMSAQAASLFQGRATMRTERKAAKIARRNEMQQLTAVDSSPYAAQADDAQAEAEAQEPMLIETSALEAPRASIGSDSGSGSESGSGSVIPAPISNSTLSRWARKLAEHCGGYSSCDTCGGDGRCAWCSSAAAAASSSSSSSSGTTGRCLALDVNANLRAGSRSGDGLTSGQCTSDAWQTSVASRLTLLSLNVFASERGNSTRRFAAIIQLIKKSSADVIALQEVEKWFVHALQAHAWVKSNYHLTEYGPGQAPGGLFILSRYPIASVNYYEAIQPGQVEVSSRGRVLVAKLGVKQQAVYVATTALDYRSSESRAASLEFIFRTLKPYKHAFLLGDFNFDEGSKSETAAIPQSYLDLWPTLITDRPGYTWDPRSNWFAASSDPQSRASRIDRVYLRSNQWMPRSIHLVGCSVSDPLCGAKNLDVKKGVTLIDANKLNPSLILAAPTNAADKAKGDKATGTKIPAFIEAAVEFLRGTPDHAQVMRALADEEAMETAMVETSAEVQANAPKPTFEPDFVPSNHYGLLVQTTQFAPRCPAPEE